MATEMRLDRVEEELTVVRDRLRRLEQGREEVAETAPAPAPIAPASIAPAPVAAEPPATGPRFLPPDLGGAPLPLPPLRRESAESPAATAPRPAPASALDFERLFGGRVLAWIGGLAILFAAVLFVGMAISRGWIDEEARTIVAALGSLGLLLGGIWLHERQGRTEAARAAVASALGGLYATILVATQAYALVSPGLGLVLAAAVAAAGFALAVRWDAPVIAAVGSLGSLAAPILTGVGIEGAGIAYDAVALAASVLILLWRRWDWLALGAFVVSAPQLLAWALLHTYALDPGRVEIGLVLPVLVGFWALYVLAAVGFELRVRDRDRADALSVSSWLILFGGCTIVVWLGYRALEAADAHTMAVIWLFGFAGIHLLLGEIAIRARLHREVGALLIGSGLAVSAFGFAQALDGPSLVTAWAAEAAVLAALSARLDGTPDAALSNRGRLLLAATAFLALAVAYTLAVEAHPAALFEGVADLGTALGAIAACAAGSLAFGWFARREDPAAARAAAFLGAAALVYLGSIAIVDTLGVDSSGEVLQAGQTWLSAFWTVTGLGAVVWGLVRRQGSIRLGGLALLGVAIVKVWTYDLAELEELARVLSFVGLGLLLLAGSFAYGRIKPGSDAAR